jgi:hypothetical protein
MTYAATTKAFFNAIDPKMKSEILTNIANHYGCSVNQAYDEVTDDDAECLLDYVTGSTRTATSLIYRGFLSKNTK